MVVKSVIATNRSANPKIGRCAITYVSQASCWTGCPHFGNGCYAENGPMGIFVTARLNRSTERRTRELAREEARAIAALPADRPLRLHGVGDCQTADAARTVAAAARDYFRRMKRYHYWAIPQNGLPVWTYTHSWRAVARRCWDGISVLASCESPAHVRQAAQRGYASALVVDRFLRNVAYVLDGVKVIPCPEQTRGVTCDKCRLCWDDQRLLKAGLTIGFEAHGSGAGKVRLSLPVV